MHIIGMIDYLDNIYPGWRRKLYQMSYNQVFAIYRHVKQQQKNNKLHELDELEHKTCHKTTYTCNDCEYIFEADNPELQECRFCGSQRIRRNDYD